MTAAHRDLQISAPSQGQPPDDTAACRVALLADVHANLAALEAVLAHAADSGAQQVWCAGDTVGYGPWPEETVSKLRAVTQEAVVGNYDLKVLKAPRKIEKMAPDQTSAQGGGVFVGLRSPAVGR